MCLPVPVRVRVQELQELLSDWCEVTLSPSLRVKFLAPAARCPAFALIQLEWTAAGLASLTFGFFACSLGERRKALTALQDKLVADGLKEKRAHPYSLSSLHSCLTLDASDRDEKDEGSLSNLTTPSPKSLRKSKTALSSYQSFANLSALQEAGSGGGKPGSGSLLFPVAGASTGDLHPAPAAGPSTGYTEKPLASLLLCSLTWKSLAKPDPSAFSSRLGRNNIFAGSNNDFLGGGGGRWDGRVPVANAGSLRMLRNYMRCHKWLWRIDQLTTLTAALQARTLQSTHTHSRAMTMLVEAQSCKRLRRRRTHTQLFPFLVLHRC